MLDTAGLFRPKVLSKERMRIFSWIIQKLVISSLKLSFQQKQNETERLSKFNYHVTQKTSRHTCLLLGLPDTTQVDWVENDSRCAEIVHFLEENSTFRQKRMVTGWHGLNTAVLNKIKKEIIMAVCTSSGIFNVSDSVFVLKQDGSNLMECSIQVYLGRWLPQWDRYPECETQWTRTRHWAIPKETQKHVAKWSKPTLTTPCICGIILICLSLINPPERRHWLCDTWGSGVALCSGSVTAWEGKPGH